MREKFKTILSPNYNDIELVEKMYHSGYKLMTIVTPNNYPYKDTVGYVYWFEYMYDIIHIYLIIHRTTGGDAIVFCKIIKNSSILHL